MAKILKFLFILRKNFSLVSQDIILFDDTILKNISYANDTASQIEIEKACKMSQRMSLSEITEVMRQ